MLPAALEPLRLPWPELFMAPVEGLDEPLVDAPEPEPECEDDLARWCFAFLALCVVLAVAEALGVELLLVPRAPDEVPPAPLPEVDWAAAGSATASETAAAMKRL